MGRISLLLQDLITKCYFLLLQAVLPNFTKLNQISKANVTRQPLALLKPSNRSTANPGDIIDRAKHFPQIVSPSYLKTLHTEFIEYQVMDFTDVAQTEI